MTRKAPLILTLVILLPLAVPAHAAVDRLYEDWESGAISTAWKVASMGAFTSTSVESVVGSIVPQPRIGGDHFLWMDKAYDRGLYGTNVIKTTHDFTGAENLVLSFWTRESNDERHVCVAHYGDYGDPSCDGALFTCDGHTWYVLWQAPASFPNWQYVSVDISANPNSCDHVTSDFAIKFMQYDNYPYPSDGIAWDNIAVTYDAPLMMGVVVDTGSYEVTATEIDELVSATSDKLYSNTGTRVVLHGVVWDDTFSDPMTEIDDYYHATAGTGNPPNLVAVLHSDAGSRGYGGYANQSSDLSAYGFCNRFDSPLAGYGQDRIYGAVIDWDHRFAACGYDLNLFYGSGVWERVSDVSLDDGSCRGSAGVPCVFNDNVGYYVCSTTEPDHPNLSSPRAYVAKVAVHELLHRFGLHGNDDHFGTPTCDAMMGGTDYRTPWDLMNSVLWANICPAVWDDFVDSYDSCY